MGLQRRVYVFTCLATAADENFLNTPISHFSQSPRLKHGFSPSDLYAFAARQQLTATTRDTMVLDTEAEELSRMLKRHHDGNFGFTVYRTFYGEQADWNLFVDRLTQHCHLSMDCE